MHHALKTIAALALLLTASGDPIFALLPAGGVPTGWQRKGEARLYVGASLYQHINGGAELYNQFGFDRLAVQDYVHEAHEVRVEIYKMKDQAGAGAVFAEITQGMIKQERFGSASVLDEYQIMFRRGVYCVSVTCYDPGPKFQDVLVALAAGIDSAIIKTGR